MKKIESRAKNISKDIKKTAVNKIRNINRALKYATSQYADQLRKRLALWQSKL